MSAIQSSALIGNVGQQQRLSGKIVSSSVVRGGISSMTTQLLTGRVSSEVTLIGSVRATTGLIGNVKIAWSKHNNIVRIEQYQYDQLVEKDPDLFYFILG